MKAQSETAARCRQQHSASAEPPPAVRLQVPFTIEEHLRVQREIEERAHRFWFAKGCALKIALDDWLKAEAEVLAEFAKSASGFANAGSTFPVIQSQNLQRK
jgi:hypothetical protein